MLFHDGKARFVLSGVKFEAFFLVVVKVGEVLALELEIGIFEFGGLL